MDKVMNFDFEKIANARLVGFGKYNFTINEILHKVEIWKLTREEQDALVFCITHGETIYISGKHGTTGKTSLVARLTDLGLDAKEIDINGLVLMNTLIENRK